jgi:hypothetical protein
VNASFGGEHARFVVESTQVVLIDPIALDGLASQLAEIGSSPGADQATQLHALGDLGLRIGLAGVPVAGTYEIGPDSFEAADLDSADPGVFDIDSGTVVIVDLSALAAVAHHFTWDRYDALLQLPVGDYSILEEVNAEVGGPRFAVVSASEAGSFNGDGAFRLRAGQPALLA